METLLKHEKLICEILLESEESKRSQEIENYYNWENEHQSHIEIIKNYLKDNDQPYENKKLIRSIYNSLLEEKNPYAR